MSIGPVSPRHWNEAPKCLQSNSGDNNAIHARALFGRIGLGTDDPGTAAARCGSLYGVYRGAEGGEGSRRFKPAASIRYRNHLALLQRQNPGSRRSLCGIEGAVGWLLPD